MTAPWEEYPDPEPCDRCFGYRTAPVGAESEDWCPACHGTGAV